MSRTIAKLPDSTIQKIAAGEVITKPVNVIKELLENSIDADASNVRITIEQGGVKLIEIYDNGHGIAMANAELLCERYTTSKLHTADDLTRISTFGFRGEALSSISELADIEVKTFNMQTDKMGWQAKYKFGGLVEPPKQTYLQFPGTLLKITNLFSTIKNRKISIQSSFLEERKAIVDLVMRYAIYYRDKITMSLKESNSSDLICLLAPMKIGPCIGMFYGLEMQNNLTEINVDSEAAGRFNLEANIIFSYKKATGSHAHTQFILFINNRLVECQDLKKELEAQVGVNLNLKQNMSLMFVALTVPPQDLDVNTHPAKATVVLHYQTEIIALLAGALKVKLEEKLATKAIPIPYTSQKTISQLAQQFSQPNLPMNNLSPMATSSPISRDRLRLLAPACLNKQQSPISVPMTPIRRQYDHVHTDSKQKTLRQECPIHREFVTHEEVRLLSIHDLRRLVAKEKAKNVAINLKNSVFVGIFDQTRALIQHETRLYVINFKAFLKEQYYQFYLYDFAHFPTIEILPPGNKIRPMIDTYLNHLKKHEPNKYDMFKYKTTDLVIGNLLKHKTMYDDYLSLKLTAEEEILTIPCIIPDEVPNLVYLGKFLVEIVNLVEYTQERNCLKNIGRVLADFYSEPPMNLRNHEVHKNYHDRIESKLYVAIKEYLIIPEWLFTKENMCQISDTKDLFKVFERC